MKKWVVMLLMLLLMMHIPVFSEDSVYTCGLYEYIVLDNGEAQICSYSGEESVLDIPSELDGKKVASIGERAFNSNTITKISIPDSVVSLGNYAFSNCKCLVEVILPDSIEEIGINPFSGSSCFYKFVVSPDHSELALINGVLYSKVDKQLICCPSGLNIKKIDIPDGIKSIDESAFYMCRNLEEVTIPDSVITIGRGAFCWCDNLSKINIPNGIDGIEPFTFSNCKKISNMIIPDSVVSIGEYAFTACIAMSEIMIPNRIENIDQAAFYMCSNLNKLTLPRSIVSIGENAFAGCDRLVVTVSRDTYAQKYCEENNLMYECNDSLDWLQE